MIFIKLYGLAALVFLVLDLIWLRLAYNYIYKQEIGHLIKSNINFVAAAAFYLIFVIGIVVFALMPSLQEGSVLKAVLLGGLLGLVAYATYDLTNLASIEGFSLKVAVIDILWGTFVGASTSGVTFIIYRWLFK